MSIASFFTNQARTLDAAESFADQHLAPSFAPVRASYAAVQIDMAKECTTLRALTKAARETLARRNVAQGEVEAFADEVKEDVSAIDTWVDVLGGALDHALLTGHPFARRLKTLMLDGSIDAESYRDTAQDLLEILTVAETGGATAGLALPAGFVAEGRALFDELLADRSAANVAEADRKAATLKLHLQLGEIERTLRSLEAARIVAARVARVDLPGFDFTLLRATGHGGGATPATGDGALPPLTPAAFPAT